MRFSCLLASMLAPILYHLRQQAAAVCDRVHPNRLRRDRRQPPRHGIRADAPADTYLQAIELGLCPHPTVWGRIVPLRDSDKDIRANDASCAVNVVRAVSANVIDGTVLVVD